MIQFAFDENGDAVFRDQEKKEKPEELEHFRCLKNIFERADFLKKYPGILFAAGKRFCGSCQSFQNRNMMKKKSAVC